MVLFIWYFRKTLDEIVISENNDWFDLNSHYRKVIKRIIKSCDVHFDVYDFEVLKTMTAFGEPLAAQILAVAYHQGEFSERGEPQPLEELRWMLVRRFLQGDLRWAFFTSDKRFYSISAEDSRLIVNEVRLWVREHPFAYRSAICAQEKTPRSQYYISAKVLREFR
ncbi:MAG: hypothetical protein KAG66_10980 [Methylococcales bacterium]|nr:hypothetical protein [Methylococcales bacterium]